MKGSERRRVLKWRDGAAPAEHIDDLVVEEPLEIRVGGRPVSVTMRTPGHDEELAAGFLLTEGVIAPPARPLMRKISPNVIEVAVDGVVDFEKLTRYIYTSSSCGLCGKASIEAVHQHFVAVQDGFTVEAAVLSHLPERLDQPLFARTGGLHAAAIFDTRGKAVVVREDVGRHNAVDKAIGFGVLRRLLPFDKHVLFVSGRVSFEIMQKALGARCAVVAAVSAPTNLAVEFAEESGQTLVGFVRDGRMNVYTHVERIT